jgi:hypothetical protein
MAALPSVRLRKCFTLVGECKRPSPTVYDSLAARSPLMFVSTLGDHANFPILLIYDRTHMGCQVTRGRLAIKLAAGCCAVNKGPVRGGACKTVLSSAPVSAARHIAISIYQPLSASRSWRNAKITCAGEYAASSQPVTANAAPYVARSQTLAPLSAPLRYRTRQLCPAPSP